MSTLGPYLILKEIGKGGYSVVMLAKHRETDDKVALKITPCDDLSADDETVVRNEINVMREIDHPHIVKLHDFDLNAEYKTRYGDVREVCYLALELCKGGDVFDWVAETGSFSDILARHYFHQLIDGLAYLHNNGISHRDLKLENILFNDKYDLKIADFGFASLQSLNRTIRGTQGYMAPEILKHEEYNGQEVDVFAAGVILFTMLSQRPPFVNPRENDNHYKYFYLNQQDRFWQKHERMNHEIQYSDSFKALVGNMLSANPHERPSVAEIKESEWYNGDLPTAEELEEEFIIRKAELDQIRNPQPRGNNDDSPGGGGHVYRSPDNDTEETKIDFSTMKIETYTPDYSRCTRFFIKDTAENLFKKLLDYQNEFALRSKLSKDEYSIFIHLKDPENVLITVNILKVENEDTHCVEVIKESGDRFKFSQAYTAIKEFFIEK